MKADFFITRVVLAKQFSENEIIVEFNFSKFLNFGKVILNALFSKKISIVCKEIPVI